MRILMLSWEYPPHIVGGLGKHVAELLPELSRAGVETHLVTPAWLGGAPVESPHPRVTVYRAPTPEGDRPDFYRTAEEANEILAGVGRAIMRDHGPFDLIHVHDWLVSFAGIQLKHEFKTPLLATIHATEYGRNRGSIVGGLQHAIHSAEWRLTYEAWRIITCSDFMRREVVTALQCPPEKIDVIPNGVDTSRFDALDGLDLSEFRARWAQPHESLVFNVGRLVYEKGVQTLIEATPRVLAGLPSTRIVIAGNGGYRPYAEQLARDRGVADHIVFAGFLPDEDRDKLFKVANVAVFPSLYEPFGIVALEAMAAKTPVIVSFVGGFTEVVENHETGITVLPGNPDSLAWGILHTLDHPEWAAARVENAYRVVRTKFSWATIAQHTITVYAQVCAERRATVW
ncbi:MAG: glycosyltransferase family 4 protein [Dehalococcoidia bacterium]|nr:glycosyltransferase family 4 protein [Dehalococcoidia bacterium]